MGHVRKLKIPVDFINNSLNTCSPFQRLMNCNKLILIILIALQILFLNGSALAVDLNWKGGDSWKMGVTFYANNLDISPSIPIEQISKNTPIILYRYLLDVRIIGSEMVNGENCWKIQYTTDPNASERRRDSYCLTWNSQKNGSLKKAMCKYNKEIKLADIDITKIGNTFVLSLFTHYGFPVEILKPGIDVYIDPNKSRWKASKTEKSDNKAVKLEVSVVSNPNREPSKFIQTWPDGSNFWSEYIKNENGYVELEAYVIGPWLEERFDKLYKEWEELKKQVNADKTQEKYNEIIKLGIAAVSYMIDKIKAGDTSLIPAVSEVTKERVSGTKYKFEVESSATREETLAWWEKNKERWSITELNPTNKQN